MSITPMRNTVLLAFILAIQTSKGQVVPNTQINPAAASSVNTTPSAYSGSSKINFVRSWDASKALSDPLEVISDSRTVEEVKKATTYLDGLGRQLQSVAWKGSPLSKDMVGLSIYDDYDREVVKYLPYSSTGNDGTFKYSGFSEQNTFYHNMYDADNNGEKVYYSKTDYESSPLGRVSKSLAPGNSWAGNNRGISQSYDVNVANEVRIWTVTTSSGALPGSSAFYNAGLLSRMVATDEDGKRAVTYKDRDGRIILRKVDNGGSDITSHTGWISTYYIYDILGNLRYVVQPKGTEWLSGNGWTFDGSTASNSNLAKEFCFIYEYDERSRVIAKKIPGASEIYLVYDKRDRIVLSQDGNQRANNQWIVNKYDELNRPTKVGLISSASSRATHQSSANADINYPTLSSSDVLIETYYDNYNWVPGGVNGISASLDQTYITSSNFFTSYNISPEFAQPISVNTLTTGMTTGMKTRILGTSNYLYVVTFYDEWGRVIQTRNTNITGGYESQTNQYDFSGKLLRSHLYHSYNQGTPQTYQVLSKLAYDHAGRLLNLKKAINGGSDKLIASYEYDELGRIKKKNLGIKPGTGSTPLEVQELTYNIRGWLNAINKKYANADPTADNFFGLDLSYDYGFSQLQYNGNIAGTKWRSKGDGDQRAYGYTYDASNRLKKADFTQYTGGWNTNAGINYTLDNVSYDGNGNITALKQYGLKVTTSMVIDDLEYKYLNTDFSNKLLSVKELGLGSNDNKLGDFTDLNTTNDDYTYDNNGNLLTDKNKNITAISYNYLNLPQTITTTKGIITYTYDASGRKLKKNVDETSKTTQYIGGFVYENDLLQFIAHEEGRLRYNSATSSWVYDYFIKDNLGNVRMVLTEQEQSDQYPALSFEGASGSQQVNDQNAFWENSSGDPISVTSARVSRPGAFGTQGTNGDYVQLLRKSTGSIGATKLMKVMAGDRIHVKVDYYHNISIVDNTGAAGLSSMINSLVGAISNSGVTSSLFKTEASNITSGLNSHTDVTNFFAPENGAGGTAPKAYLHVLLFDERFKFDQTNSFVQQVSSSPGANTIDKFAGNAVAVKKSGYAFVYISNESDQLVYFDNLLLTHERGRILAESHFYPFGLTMTGISGKALFFGGPQNKKGFNEGNELQSKEFSDGTGLELYDATFRKYDAQIGRFHQVDPLADISDDWTPYHFGWNNPILYNDPLGLFPKQSNYKSDDEENRRNERYSNYEPQYYTGWVRDQNGKVYFDPKAHSPSTTKPGETYIGEEIIIQNANGEPVGFGNDQGGITFNVTLIAVIVKGKSRNGWATFKMLHNPVDSYGSAATMALGEGIRYNQWWWYDANYKFRSTNLLNRQANGKFVRGVQGYRNGYNNAISKAKVFSRIGSSLQVASCVVSVVDMGVNGVNAQNSVDLAIGIVSLAPGFGWIIGGTYLLANFVSECINGKSLVENITGKEYD